MLDRTYRTYTTSRCRRCRARPLNIDSYNATACISVGDPSNKMDKTELVNLVSSKAGLSQEQAAQPSPNTASIDRKAKIAEVDARLDEIGRSEATDKELRLSELVYTITTTRTR